MRTNLRLIRQMVLMAAGVLAMTSVSVRSEVEKSSTPRNLYQQALHQQDALGNSGQAIALYQQVLEARVVDQTVAAQAELRLAQLLQKVGRVAEAHTHFRNIVNSYSGAAKMSTIVESARTEASAIETSISPPGLTLREVRSNLRGGPSFPYGISADGRYVSSWDAETSNVAVYDLSQGDSRLLTAYNSKIGFTDVNAISPDGKWIAFTFYNFGLKKEYPVELRIIGVDGKGERTIDRFGSEPKRDWVVPLAWTVDSQKIIAFIRPGGLDRSSLYELASFDILNGTKVVLAQMESSRRYRGGHGVSGSPDGKYIAYDFAASKENLEGEIKVIASDGKPVSTVAPSPWHDYVLGWAPDGKHLLFCSNRSGSYGIWSITMNGGEPSSEPQLVKPDVGEIGSVGLTADEALYFTAQKERNHIYLAGFDPDTGKITETPRKVTERLSRHPMWSPDGERLAYLTWRGPAGMAASQLSVQSVGSQEFRDITPGIEVNRRTTAKWHEDGNSILLVGRNTGEATDSVFKIDLGTGDAEAISGGLIRNRIEESSDGRRVYVTADRHASLVMRDLETGQEKVLYTNPTGGYLRGLSLSPNGSEIAFIRRHGTVEDGQPTPKTLDVLTIDTGEVREVFRIKDGEFAGWNRRAVAWTPDAQRIIFAVERLTGSPGQKSELWSVSAQGGTPKKAGFTSDGRIHDLSISPDGKKLGFSLNQSIEELWVMENFLPGGE